MTTTAGFVEPEFPFTARVRASDRERLLVDLVTSVWATTLDLPITVRPDDPAAAPDRPVAAALRIGGAHALTVVVAAPWALAAECAAAFYARDAASLGAEEVRDAWGELGNQVVGNLKALVDPPCTLSLPVVTEGPVPEPEGRRLNAVTFACLGSRLRLTVVSHHAPATAG